MNFKEWFFNENTVAQELKKVPDDVLKEIKTKVDSVFKTIFNFEVDDKKTKEIKDWIAFNTSKDTEFPRFLDPHRDFLITKYNTINFKDPDYDIEKLIEDSIKYHDDLKKNTKVGSRGAYGITLISFPDGWKWLDLQKGFCRIEGAAMGHCGNVEGQNNNDHNIFSLRDPRNVPYLTFIDTGNGQLGEMKGRFNQKPEKKFHPYIIALLKHPRITKIVGGGYEPLQNFSLNDLSKEDKQDLLKEKPDLRLLPSDLMFAYDNQGFIQSLAEYDAVLPDGNIQEDKIKEIEKDDKNTKFVIDEFKRLRPKYPLFIAIALAKTGNTVQSPLKEETVENYLELKKINYIQIENHLVELYQYQKNIFNQIFNKLDAEAKSSFVKTATNQEQKLPDHFYQFLSSNDIYYLLSRAQDGLKLPQALHDLIKKHDEFDAMTGEIVIPKSSAFGKILSIILSKNLYKNVSTTNYFQISKLNYKIAFETVFDYMVSNTFGSSYYMTSKTFGSSPGSSSFAEEDKKYIYAMLNYYKINQKPIKEIISFIKEWVDNMEFEGQSITNDGLGIILSYIKYYLSDASVNWYRGIQTISNLWMDAIQYYNTKYKNKSRTLDNILISFTNKLVKELNDPHHKGFYSIIQKQFQNQIDNIKYENKYTKKK